MIEGEAGVRMYEMITKAFDLCVALDAYYKLGRVNNSLAVKSKANIFNI